MSKRITRNQKSLLLDEVFQNSVSIDTREIFLHSHYADEDPAIDYRQADTFMKGLRVLLGLSNTQPITIHFNSVGGSYYDGMGIYDAIATCPVPVTMLGYGLIGSMATIIMQAADNRILMPHTSFLIHYGYESMFGTHTEAMSYGEYAIKCRERMLDIYVASTMKTNLFKNERAARQFLDAKIKEKSDWWLTAEEAIYYGFADSVFSAETVLGVL
jgi:ATP-dependent protease ClpP protease subunit